MNVIGFLKNIREMFNRLILLYTSMIFLLIHKMDSEEVDQQKLLTILYNVY